jgi:hypothetical protein
MKSKSILNPAQGIVCAQPPRTKMQSTMHGSVHGMHCNIFTVVLVLVLVLVLLYST